MAVWFDDRFKVNYRAQTINTIFDQVPFSDIHYELDESVKDKKGQFNFTSPDISRRELLQKIQEHWDLEIVLVYDDGVNPNAVRINAAK